jgi:hypothetical protein
MCKVARLGGRGGGGGVAKRGRARLEVYLSSIFKGGGGRI